MENNKATTVKLQHQTRQQQHQQQQQQQQQNLHIHQSKKNLCRKSSSKCHS